MLHTITYATYQQWRNPGKELNKKNSIMNKDGPIIIIEDDADDQ